MSDINEEIEKFLRNMQNLLESRDEVKEKLEELSKQQHRDLHDLLRQQVETEECESEDKPKIVKLKNGEWFYCSEIDHHSQENILKFTFYGETDDPTRYLIQPSIDDDLQIYPKYPGATLTTPQQNVEYIISF